MSENVGSPLAAEEAQTRTIKDPIHDYITFSTNIWEIIDTPQFQRLRSVKQLGVSYYVWAGATHNRFEHCIGVAHLAGMLVKRLKQIQPELGITDRDVRCVQLAGLCHDLGHGPWSHVWDGHFIPAALPGADWTHEQASEMMFEDLVEDNMINIEREDVDFIKDLIKGFPKHSAHNSPPEKAFLFEIVANKRNGLDVDKFDYIARDVRAVGAHHNFSAQRIIESARVIDGEICYHIKDANAIYEVYSLRFGNHKTIYNHKTARAIEYMLIDILLKAEDAMKIAERIHDPKRYIYLTDNILETIEMSDDPRLEESRQIIKRIRCRKLYHYVDWTIVNWPQRDLVKQITAERIVEAAKAHNFSSEESDLDRELLNELSADQVIADISMLHYGMKEKFPLDFVKFYGKYNKHEAMHAEPGELTTVIPEYHAEYCVRVYTKDPRFHGLIQAGYRDLWTNIRREHGLLADIPELDLSDSSTPPTTEAPTTPRRVPSDTNPHSATPSRTGSNEKLPTALKTPFTTDNKFTKVKPSYAPPSPTQGVRRAQGSPARGLSSLSGGGVISLLGDKIGKSLTAQESVASFGGSTVVDGRTPEPSQSQPTDTEKDAPDETQTQTPKRTSRGRERPLSTAEVRAPRSARLKRPAEPHASPGRKGNDGATPTKRRK